MLTGGRSAATHIPRGAAASCATCASGGSRPSVISDAAGQETGTGFHSSGILQEGIYRVEACCSASICSNEGETDAADISTIFTTYGAP